MKQEEKKTRVTDLRVPKLILINNTLGLICLLVEWERVELAEEVIEGVGQSQHALSISNKMNNSIAQC